MITLITGGIKSGKSNYAVAKAKKAKGKIAFLATAIGFDEEMQDRIKKHQASRPGHWNLIEESLNVPKVLINLDQQYDTVLLDCLGLLISNLLLNNLSNDEIMQEIAKLTEVIQNFKSRLIIVTNEVGSSLIPENKLGRRFCDLLGMTNQKIAAVADNVILMASGLPITLK